MRLLILVLLVCLAALPAFSADGSIAVGAVYSVSIPPTNGYASSGDILAANASVNGNWTHFGVLEFSNVRSQDSRRVRG